MGMMGKHIWGISKGIYTSVHKSHGKTLTDWLLAHVWTWMNTNLGAHHTNLDAHHTQIWKLLQVSDASLETLARRSQFPNFSNLDPSISEPVKSFRISTVSARHLPVVCLLIGRSRRGQVGSSGNVSVLADSIEVSYVGPRYRRIAVSQQQLL